MLFQSIFASKYKIRLKKVQQFKKLCEAVYADGVMTSDEAGEPCMEFTAEKRKGQPGFAECPHARQFASELELHSLNRTFLLRYP